MKCEALQKGPHITWMMSEAVGQDGLDTPLANARGIIFLCSVVDTRNVQR